METSSIIRFISVLCILGALQGCAHAPSLPLNQAVTPEHEMNFRVVASSSPISITLEPESELNPEDAKPGFSISFAGGDALNDALFISSRWDLCNNYMNYVLGFSRNRELHYDRFQGVRPAGGIRTITLEYLGAEAGLFHYQFNVDGHQRIVKVERKIRRLDIESNAHYQMTSSNLVVTKNVNPI